MTGNNSGRGGCALLFNLLTLLIIGLILLVVAGFVVALTSPELVEPLTTRLGVGERREAPEPTATRVAAAIVPTSTTAPTPSLLISPTWTPRGQQPQAAATATNTRRPTGEPTITPTFPPPTATPTPTDTPTSTPTPGPSPTATQTRSPFPFTASGPMYLQNFANAAGCNWLGIGGEVLDLNRNPVPAGQYQVHVWACGLDERTAVGAAPAYGPSGYEQFIFNAPVVRQCNVQLETANGTAVSQVYSVDTRASCNQNLALFNFVQNH